MSLSITMTFLSTVIAVGEFLTQFFLYFTLKQPKRKKCLLNTSSFAIKKAGLTLPTN